MFKIDGQVEAVEAAIAGYRSEIDVFFATLETETDPVAIARHASQRPVFPALDAIASAAVSDAAAAPASETAVADAPGVAAAEPATAAADATSPVDGAPVADASRAVAQAPDEAVADATVADTAAAPEPATDSPAPVPIMAPRGADKLAESWAAWSGIPADPAVIKLTASIAGPDAEPADEIEVAAPAADDPPEPIPLAASAVVSGKGKVLQTVPTSRPMSWLRRDQKSTDQSNDDR